MRLVLIIICCPLWLFAQPPADRYQAPLFTTVAETSNIKFSSGVPQPVPGGGFYETVSGMPVNVDEFETTSEDLFMDIFEPVGDTLTQRPLVIVAFGGGFVAGSRDHWSMRLICEELAKRGYVTASIDYRLGMNIFDSDLAQRAVYRGVQDARSAVRFFKADAAGDNNYKIDPNKIFIGGHSSGGLSALHNIYLDKESERPLSTYVWSQEGNFVADQGCLDCVGDNQSYSGYANGVFSLAGALGFTSFIESDADPKSVMFHSQDDGTVPYDEGEPFTDLSFWIIGEDLPTVYGSQSIAERCDSVSLPYDFFSYSSRGHDVHEDGGSSLYSDIIPGITDWFFQEELQPKDDLITGENIACTASPVLEYSVDDTEAYYFDWQVTGGSIVNLSNYESTVSVVWDTNATGHKLEVTPYSILDAKGETITIDIELLTSADNNFLAITSDWHSIQNWSLGHLPTACEDVILNSAGTISSAADFNIHSLEVRADATLILGAGTNNFINHRADSQLDFALDITGSLTNLGILNVQHRRIERNILHHMNSYFSSKLYIDK